MAKIFIFREGQTLDNKDNTFSGWRNVDLSPQGIEEAKQIGLKLKDEKVTISYQSDLIRSKNMLKLVLNGYHANVEVITDPRIKERDYGNLTGKNKDEVKRQFPDKFPLWHRSYEEGPPGGESIRTVEERILDFLNDVIPTWKPEDIIFISGHGNSIRPMRRYFEHISVSQMCSYEYTPAEIFTYEA